MKVEFDFKAYMLDIATKLKEIAHTEEEPHFHRVTSVANLEELLQNALSTSGLQLCIQDTPDGNLFDDKGDLFLDDSFYVFYLLENVGSDSMEDRSTIIDNCKLVFKKIVSKFTKDYVIDHGAPVAGQTNRFKFMDRNTFRYQTVGPVGDQYHGLMIVFTVPETFSYVYKASDWLE